MKLDTRKLKILAAVTQMYISTGEPVGSKALCGVFDNSVSSATLRNEMAALEKMGLLEQPHTSAGRTPTQLGLRLYIDRLMDKKQLSKKDKEAIDALFEGTGQDPEKLFEQAGAALAHFTGCAALMATPAPDKVTIRQIELVPMGPRSFVLLLISSSGMIKNKVCRTDNELTPEQAAFFSNFCAGTLAGQRVEEITLGAVQTMAVSMGEHSFALSPLLFAVYELCRETSEGHLYLKGQTNLLGYRELGDNVADLFRFLSRTDELMQLINWRAGDLGVLLGSELGAAPLANSSIVVTRYCYGEDCGGSVGIIGPVRIDYARIIPSLEYFANHLGKLLSDAFGGEQEET